MTSASSQCGISNCEPAGCLRFMVRPDLQRCKSRGNDHLARTPRSLHHSTEFERCPTRASQRQRMLHVRTRMNGLRALRPTLERAPTRCNGVLSRRTALWCETLKDAMGWSTQLEATLGRRTRLRVVVGHDPSARADRTAPGRSMCTRWPAPPITATAACGTSRSRRPASRRGTRRSTEPNAA